MTALLRPQHEKFCFELAELELRNEPGARAEAYKRAGYVPNPDNARKLANKPSIRARLAELIAERLEYQRIKVDSVAVDIRRIGSANMKRYYRVVPGDGGVAREELIPVTELPEHLAAAIKTVKYDADGRMSYELHDKNQANFTLLKHLGGLPEPEPPAPGDNILNVFTLEDQRILATLLGALATGEIRIGNAGEIVAGRPAAVVEHVPHKAGAS